jgi:hypothetical protein
VRRLAEGDDPALVDERHPVAEPLSMKWMTSTILTPLSRTLSIRPDGANCRLA